MNDPQIRAAFPVPETPATLDAKIDRALAASTRTKAAPRRLALGFALTAVVAVALVALPTRQAKASLVSILGALESSPHVRIVQCAVDEDGRQIPYRTVDSEGGNSHAYRIDGTEDRYDEGSQSLVYSRLLKAFVASPRNMAFASRRRVRFVPGHEVANGLDTTVEKVKENGVEFYRAVETTPKGEHRFVIDAALDTKRPFAARHQVPVGGRWRTLEATTFDYRAPFEVAPPEPAQATRLTETVADRAYVRLLSDRTVAQVPLKGGRIAVRRVDVAEDGTVYVAFQRGTEPDDGFDGYTFRLTDSLGTEYARIGQTYERTFGKAAGSDGAFEMEAFVPVTHENGWQPRTLTLQAHRFADLRWAGTLDRTTFDNAGNPKPWPGILMQSPEDRDPQPFDLPGVRLDRPTCANAPDWSALFGDGRFDNALLTRVSKVEAQIARAKDERRYADVIELCDEEIDLIREGRQAGQGLASTAGPQDERAKAQRALGRGKP